jgi:hypothetical protein
MVASVRDLTSFTPSQLRTVTGWSSNFGDVPTLTTDSIVATANVDGDFFFEGLVPLVVFPSGTKMIEYQFKLNFLSDIFLSTTDINWFFWFSAQTLPPDYDFVFGSTQEDVIDSLKNYPGITFRIGSVNDGSPMDFGAGLKMYPPYGGTRVWDDVRDPVASDLSYEVRVRIPFGAEVLVKVWPVGDAEPSGWMSTKQNVIPTGFPFDEELGYSPSVTHFLGGPEWTSYAELRFGYDIFGGAAFGVSSLTDLKVYSM